MDRLFKKALVVDDNRAHRQLVASLLETIGYTAFTAIDGDDGLTILFQHNEIELVITDIFMPNREGVGFIRAARARNADLKIVAITGAANFTTISDTVMHFGADMIIKKPFDIDAFTDKLNHLVAVDG